MRILRLLVVLWFQVILVAHAQGKFNIVMLSDSVIGSARLLAEPVKGRWGAVEVQSTIIIEKGRYINSSRRIVSIDCSNKGMETIRQFYNLETDEGKP